MKKTTIGIVTLLIISVFWACNRSPAGNALWTNPGAITSRIDKFGAKIVLSEAYYDKTGWKQVLAGISTGNPEWLKIASVLRGASEAGASEELTLALGEALGNRPLDVLRFLIKSGMPAQPVKAGVFDVDSLCRGVDIDDDRFNSTELALREIDKRKQALSGVTDPELKNMRDTCIRKLEASKTAISRYFQTHRQKQ